MTDVCLTLVFMDDSRGNEYKVTILAQRISYKLCIDGTSPFRAWEAGLLALIEPGDKVDIVTLRMAVCYIY